MSDLDAVLRPHIGDVQDLLYDDMVRQGWFGERPDSVRSRWTTAGWVLVVAGVVLTGVLAAVSTFGLVGLAVVLAGVAFTASGQVAPARTSRGSRVMRELQDFREYLAAADTRRHPARPAGGAGVAVLPVRRRLRPRRPVGCCPGRMDVDDTPDEPLYWYGAPQNWHLSDAVTSLAAHGVGAQLLPRLPPPPRPGLTVSPAVGLSTMPASTAQPKVCLPVGLGEPAWSGAGRRSRVDDVDDAAGAAGSRRSRTRPRS